MNYICKFDLSNVKHQNSQCLTSILTRFFKQFGLKINLLELKIAARTLQSSATRTTPVQSPTATNMERAMHSLCYFSQFIAMPRGNKSNERWL